MEKIATKVKFMFTVFTVITLLVSGIATYYSQMSIYRVQCQNDVRNVGEYLTSLIEKEGDDFINFQKYTLANYTKMEVPVDFTEYQSAQSDFYSAVAKEFPGRTFGVDLDANELPEAILLKYLVYNYEYWTLLFDQAKSDFGLNCTYYLIFIPEESKATYFIDFVRGNIKDHEDETKYTNAIDDSMESYSEEYKEKNMYIMDTYTYPREKYSLMWATYESGEKQNGYHVFDNEYGNTYSYYVPVIVNGKVIGVTGSEIDVSRVNHDIMMNTLRQFGILGGILLVFIVAMVILINRNFIAKIVKLEDSVRAYSLSKDTAITKNIETCVTNHDELSSLAEQIILMIFEIESHIKNLLHTTRELVSTKEEVARMGELATRDALTGIRNKMAYDAEVQKIEWDIGNGIAEFGIAMVDLNFLKKINDIFGHEKGNIAIKNLCSLVCAVFDHSPVFRIGGDEFVVVLKGSDYDHADELIAEFNAKLEEYKENDKLSPWERISASIGYARYVPGQDAGVDNVFKRADKAMYARKKAMKAVRTE